MTEDKNQKVKEIKKNFTLECIEQHEHSLYRVFKKTCSQNFEIE